MLKRANAAHQAGDTEAFRRWAERYQAAAGKRDRHPVPERDQHGETATAALRRAYRERINKATEGIEKAKASLATAQARAKAVEMANPYPHLTTFESLEGARATRYLKEHGAAIRLEADERSAAARKASAKANKPRVVDCREAVEAHQRRTNPFRRTI